MQPLHKLCSIVIHKYDVSLVDNSTSPCFFFVLCYCISVDNCYFFFFQSVVLKHLLACPCILPFIEEVDYFLVAISHHYRAFQSIRLCVAIAFKHDVSVLTSLSITLISLFSKGDMRFIFRKNDHIF